MTTPIQYSIRRCHSCLIQQSNKSPHSKYKTSPTIWFGYFILRTLHMAKKKAEMDWKLAKANKGCLGIADAREKCYCPLQNGFKFLAREKCSGVLAERVHLFFDGHTMTLKRVKEEDLGVEMNSMKPLMHLLCNPPEWNSHKSLSTTPANLILGWWLFTLFVNNIKKHKPLGGRGEYTFF